MEYPKTRNSESIAYTEVNIPLNLERSARDIAASNRRERVEKAGPNASFDANETLLCWYVYCTRFKCEFVLEEPETDNFFFARRTHLPFILLKYAFTEQKQSRMEKIAVALCAEAQRLETTVERLKARSSAADRALEGLNDQDSNEITFTIQGKREKIDGPEAVALLTGLDPKSTRIKLSSKGFTRAAADAVVPILENLPNLVYADLSDIIASIPEEEALYVLVTICAAVAKSSPRLVGIDLSDNALGEKGIRALTPFFSTTALQELVLHNNGLSALSVKLLDEALPDVSTLRLLSFDNNMSGDDGAVFCSALIRRASSTLQSFRMSSSRVRAKGTNALIRALLECADIRSIDLNDSMMGSENVELLAVSNFGPKCTSLVLRDVGIEDVSVLIHDEDFFTLFNSLTKLDLGLCEITVDQVDMLSSVVPYETIETLILAENELESEGVLRLLDGLRGRVQKLEHLDLSSNQVGSRGALKAAYFALENDVGFLDLSENQISLQAIETIKNACEGRRITVSFEENDEEGDDDDEDDALIGAFKDLKTC